VSTFLAQTGMAPQLGNVPSYDSPETAVAALAGAVTYAGWRQRQVGALPELAEQPGVLDGDDCLSSEVFDEFDLLVSEWPNFSTIDCDYSNGFVVFKDRHATTVRMPPISTASTVLG